MISHALPCAVAIFIALLLITYYPSFDERAPQLPRHVF